MTRYLFRKMDEVTPKLNPRLANGVAVEQLNQAVEYIRSVMESAAKSFIAGMKFLGCDLVLPHEEYQQFNLKNKGTYDLAVSNIYLIKFRLAYNDVELAPRYCYCLFPDKGGFTMINNVNHLVMPTLNDIVFSITRDSIFVRLLRDRMLFQRTTHPILELGLTPHENRALELSVVYSPIHKKKAPKVFVPAYTTNMHYLLAKFGFTETFIRFAGFTPIIGREEINYHTYDPEQYVIIGSAKAVPPKAVAKSLQWAPSDIRVAVPKAHYNSRTKAMLAGFFYVVDHFPLRIRPEYVDKTRLWRTLLGLMIYSAGTNEGALFENISEHMASLDHYLDVIVLHQLREIGFKVNDIYEILALLLDRFGDWLRLSADRINSLYDKELNVNYFVLFPITSGIFTMVFKLNKLLNTRRMGKKTIDVREINKILDRHWPLRRIYDITKNGQEVFALTSPNDNMALRLTSMMIPQTANESKQSSGINLNDPALRLHASIAEVGGYSSMSKKAPRGDRRLNHYAVVDEYWRVGRHADLAPMLDQAQSLINSRRRDTLGDD